MRDPYLTVWFDIPMLRTHSRHSKGIFIQNPGKLPPLARIQLH
jgi:hypothetical protein